MTDELRWFLLSKKKIEGLIVSAVRNFRRAGIEPILIKGWAAALNYPPTRPRFFGDIDLAVSGLDYERAEQLANDPASGILAVDVHRELRHLDTLPWAELMANSELVEIDGEAIRILSPEDHLRVLCVHWLADGGENRERLWDIYYAVSNRPIDFDWDKCLGRAPENRRTWIISAIGLAHIYLELDIRALPFEAEAQRLPVWLTRTVEREWESGTRLRPLHTALKDRAALLTQIRKRLRPNPIQATVLCEGRFDSGSRFPYQVRSVVMRLRPSLGRIIPALRNNER